jgi:FMN-dependent NADH-azoreductase
MTNILVVECSPRSDRSIGRRLTRELIASLRLAHPGSGILERDLAAHPLPPLDEPAIAAMYASPGARTAVQREAIRLSDVLVDELLAADILVIAAPMWNLGIPPALKGWIDHIVRAGRTFVAGPAGPRGLAGGRQAYLISTRGSVLPDALAPQMDFQERYLRVILGYIGITDLAVIRAEGLDHPELVRGAVESAKRTIDGLFALVAARP